MKTPSTAEEAKPSLLPSGRPTTHLIIHCAATKPSMDIGAVEIDKWHRALGWFGCGYHYIIRRDGTLESEALGQRCRPLEKAGAHVGDCGPAWNGKSLGICMAGGVAEDGKTPEDNFTDEQRETLRDLLMRFRAEDPSLTIMGHRDLIAATKAPPKACPSFDVVKWLKSVGLAG